MRMSLLLMSLVAYLRWVVTHLRFRLNPHIKVIVCTEAIDPSNAIDLLRPYHLIVDCTDRPLTRYLLSDTSVLLNLPLISGAAISSAGQWAVYGGTTSSGKKRACYRCMWPSIVGEGGGRCDEEGVWGPVVGMVGVAMAGEVLKVIMGKNGGSSISIPALGSES